jgi:hypothetical protein
VLQPVGEAHLAGYLRCKLHILKDAWLYLYMASHRQCTIFATPPFQELALNLTDVPMYDFYLLLYRRSTGSHHG